MQISYCTSLRDFGSTTFIVFHSCCHWTSGEWKRLAWSHLSRFQMIWAWRKLHECVYGKNPMNSLNPHINKWLYWHLQQRNGIGCVQLVQIRTSHTPTKPLWPMSFICTSFQMFGIHSKFRGRCCRIGARWIKVVATVDPRGSPLNPGL